VGYGLRRPRHAAGRGECWSWRGWVIGLRKKHVQGHVHDQNPHLLPRPRSCRHRWYSTRPCAATRCVRRKESCMSWAEQPDGVLAVLALSYCTHACVAWVACLSLENAFAHSASLPPHTRPYSLHVQEIMTDPSYKGQFVCFTCPHIGNVGINPGAPSLWQSFHLSKTYPQAWRSDGLSTGLVWKPALLSKDVWGAAWAVFKDRDYMIGPS